MFFAQYRLINKANFSENRFLLQIPYFRFYLPFNNYQMKIALKLVLFVFWVRVITFNSFAQNQNKIDSLENELKKHEASKKESGDFATSLYDTSLAKNLIQLSQAYWGNNPDKAMDYAKQALTLSEQIGYKKGIGNAYNSMGTVYSMKGDKISSLDVFKKSLKIREEMGDKKGMAGSYNNIGIIYGDQGFYPEALKQYFAALKINEETGNKLWQAYNLGNIGTNYRSQGNFEEALKYHLAALKIEEELADSPTIARSLGNIGGIYCDFFMDYPRALVYFQQALTINERRGNLNDIARDYSYFGKVYENLRDYTKAFVYYQKAIKIWEEIGNKEEVSGMYINLAIIYTKEKKYKEASQYLNNSFAISKEMNNLEHFMYYYNYYSQLDSSQGNFEQAFAKYKLFVIYRDSLVNYENTKKTLQLQMQYDFDKKESLAKAEQEKKDTVQKLTRNILIGGLAVVLIFAFIFLSQRIKISKGKKKSDELLLNILPAEVAEELKLNGNSKTKTFSMVSVMFTDFKDFTQISQRLSAELVVAELHDCFSAFDSILQKHKVEKIKTIGDAYMCVSGLPALSQTHAFDLVNAAFEFMDFMIRRKKEKEAKGEFSFELRIGINTGPVVAGIVWIKKISYDIWGGTVNLAARMEQNSESGRINISGSTFELVKDKFTCTHRGKISAKGKGEIDMYFVSRSLGEG